MPKPKCKSKGEKKTGQKACGAAVSGRTKRRKHTRSTAREFSSLAERISGDSSSSDGESVSADISINLAMWVRIVISKCT